MVFDREGVAAALPAYEIGGELGRGAFGVVIGARHRSLHREVAIKQLPRALAQDKDVRSRFLAEARVLASMNHPHVVPVYDFVDHQQLCLLVMERLTGGTVWERFQSEGISARSACAIAVAASAGLHHAHQLGVLHRDVKPDNLMFSSTGILKVADFGIAKVVGGSKSVATAAGMILGTPAYIAPEQVLATGVGPETDVYATATVLYELLAGELPYPPTKTAMDTLHQHVNDDPRPLSSVAPRVPRPLAQVVMRGLNKEPADRYSSAKAMGDAVALAAAEAWGPDWLEASGEEVMAGAISAPPPPPPRAPAPRPRPPAPRPPAPRPAAPPPRQPSAPSVPPAGEGRPVLPFAAAGVVLVAIIVAAAVLLMRHDKPQQATPPITPATTSATQAPPATRRFLTVEYDRATEATQQAYSAWRHGDRAVALQVATAAAVDELFRLPFKEGKANACGDSSSNEIDCSYDYGTTIIGFRYDVKARQITAARLPT